MATWQRQISIKQEKRGRILENKAPFKFDEEVYWLEKQYLPSFDFLFPDFQVKRHLVRYRGRSFDKAGSEKAIVMNSDGEMLYVKYSELEPLNSN